MSVSVPFAPELPSDWQARLRERLLSAPDHRLDYCYIGAGRLGDLAPPLRARVTQGLMHEPQAAAVLVPIVAHEAAPTLLLTVRASHLRRHAGQISFPGGQLESGAEEPVAAAVRETGEELGIAPEFIAPLGFLADHLVRTGFRVTPVVALLRPGFSVRLQASEVADSFELPLAHALAFGNYRARQLPPQELELGGWELSFGERTIWGATAGMLAQLAELLGRTLAVAGPADARGERP